MDTYDLRRITEKAYSDDLDHPLLLHRTIAAASIPETLSLIPGSQPPVSLAASLDHQFTKDGASRVEVRGFIQAAAAGETVTLRHMLFPLFGKLSSPQTPISAARQQAGGYDLGVVQYQASGLEYDAIHPITGEAAVGLKFFEFSQVLASTFILHEDLLRFAPDPTSAHHPATGRALLTIVDMWGNNGYYAGATAKSGGVTNVIIGCRRVT